MTAGKEDVQAYQSSADRQPAVLYVQCTVVCAIVYSRHSHYSISIPHTVTCVIDELGKPGAEGQQLAGYEPG